MTRSFRCARCGACCRWEGPVRVTEEEINAIAEFLEIAVEDFIRDFTFLTRDRQGLSLLEKKDGSCLYYDDKAHCCLIQEVKPKQCRDFPVHWNFPGWGKFCKGAGRS